MIAPKYLTTLTANAREADEKAVWPAASWDALAQAGWSISPDYGGAGLASTALLILIT